MDFRCRRSWGKGLERSHRFAPWLTILIFLWMTPSIASAQSGPSRQLTLVRPGDGGFEQLLNDNYPGFENLDGYAAFRPYLVLLRNDTSHSARAYAIEWNIQSSSGLSHFRARSYFMQEHNAPASMRGAMAPGELRLISSLFDVSPTEYKKRADGIANVLSTFSSHPPYSSANIESVDVSVDAVIYDVGAYVGSDHFQLSMRYQCLRAAEHDVAESVLKLMDAKAPTADVVALLEHEVQAGRAANAGRGRDDQVSECAYYRLKEAQAFLAAYRRGGVDTLMAKAWAVIQHPSEKISPLAPQ
ncbi:MAG: hypothetical protein ACRD50_13215 [Candidatus Acidiferrales bacterium]